VAWAKGAGATDAEALELTIKLYVSEVRRRLDKAAGIARAADACAGAGFCDKAVEITLDIEQPLYEATTLLNAASLLSRLSKSSWRFGHLPPPRQRLALPRGQGRAGKDAAITQEDLVKLSDSQLTIAAPEEPKHKRALSDPFPAKRVVRAAGAKTATKVQKRPRIGAAKRIARAKTTKKMPSKQKQPSKQDSVIALLRRSEGATLGVLAKATGWQPHSVRGFLAGTVRKKLKLPLQS
jgi:hypothetical protein